MEKAPNIILFITHDQGQFLGCYDSPQAPNSLFTPNLDKVAENGVRFSNYFCTAPQCSPSRGSIKTSLYPHQNGLMGLTNLGWSLPETNKTLAMYLKQSGYTTHLLGLQHETRDAKTLGYDTISKRGAEFKYSCKRMEEIYLNFFSEHLNDQKPFFVNIGTIEVHRPFKAWAEPVDPRSVKVPPFLPDNEMIREDLAEYYGAINHIDITVQKLMNHLEALELIDNTLFIYTTDHGSPFPRAKCTLYDPGIKTLLLMSWPNSNLFKKNTVINNMISNIDLFPTILDLIGAKIPKTIEGKSFLPILEYEDEVFRNEIFMEKTYHEIYDPMRGIRTENYKYIINFEKSETLYQIPLDILRDPSGQYAKQIYNEPRNEEELYDLKNDPNEISNLAYNSSYKDIKLQLKQRLFDWMKKTEDPILKGRIKDLRSDYPRHY